MPKDKKQLTKLKVGRALPKGNNLTDTSFKAKKIQTKGQIKQYVGNPEDRQKFEVLEWLKSLHSNNNQTKLHMLSKISGFVNSDLKSVPPEFDDIFNAMLELTLNHEFKVRKQALIIVKRILAVMSRSKVLPNFAKLKTHISCATTHIDLGIRKDSLKLIGMGLQYFPDTVCKLHSLLDKILGLISHESKKRKRNHDIVSVVLTVPFMEENTIWWQNVLQCISLFLQSNASALKPGEQEDFEFSELELESKVALMRCHSGDEYGCSFYDAWVSELDEVDFNTDKEAFEHFMDKLMQILLAIWTEVGPSTLTLLSENSFNDLEMMVVVLEIICHLIKWIDCGKNEKYLKGRLCLTYNKNMSEKFFSKFPFSGSANEITVSCLNNKVCQIYSELILNGPRPQTIDVMVSNYLLQRIKEDQGLDVDEVKHITELLKNFIKHEDIALLYAEHLGILFRYLDCSANERVKKLLFSFFFDLVSMLPRWPSLRDTEAIVRFLGQLPSQFIKIAVSSVGGNHYDGSDFLKRIHRIPGYWNLKMQQSVIEAFDEIVFHMKSEDFLIGSTAVNLIVRLQSISKLQFADIAAVVRTGGVSSKVLEKLLTALVSRVNDTDPDFNIQNFLSFLLNLVFGKGAIVEYPAERQLENAEDHIPFKLSSFTVIKQRELEMQKNTADLVFHHLGNLLNQKPVYTYIKGYLMLFLKQSPIVSFDVAISIFKFAKFNPHHVARTEDRDFTHKMADLYVGCLLHLISLGFTCGSDANSNENAYEDLMQHILKISYIFEVLDAKASAIEFASQLIAVEQLIIQILKTPVEESDISDYTAIFKFFTHLNRKFPSHFSQLDWWVQMFDHVKRVCIY